MCREHHLVGVALVSLLIISISIGFVAAIPEDDVIVVWHFDEGSGFVLGDSSGNKNDGKIEGASWTTGVSSSALRFDGIDDYVIVPNDPTLNPQKAISFETAK